LGVTDISVGRGAPNAANNGFFPDSTALLVDGLPERAFWWNFETDKIVSFRRAARLIAGAQTFTRWPIGLYWTSRRYSAISDTEAGKDIATWAAHDGGVLSAMFRLKLINISGGRDRSVAIWTG